jgi:hypothetical protein
MNRTVLKWIACLTMLIDHAGLILFPQVQWMKWIGRLSFPLFAFFIAQGCRYTSNKLRYFLRVFLLGVFCQTVFTLSQLPSGRIYSFYFNTLFTFSLSILLCFLFLAHEKAAESGDSRKATLLAFLLIVAVLAVSALIPFMKHLDRTTAYQVYLDYGLPGVLLPLAAVAFRDRQKQFLGFSIGILIFCYVCKDRVPYVWWALADIPLIALYNGQKGRSAFRYGFYLFYPLHLGILYLIGAIF